MLEILDIIADLTPVLKWNRTPPFNTTVYVLE